MPTWDGGGNVPPELGVARRLIARGHQVHVIADPTLRDDARGVGATFSVWERAPHMTSLAPSEDLIRDWETQNPLVLLQRVRDRLIGGPAADFAADTAAAIEEFHPDVVVSDAFLFGAVIAAQAATLPVALLMSNIWMMPTPGSPAIGPGFAPAKTVLGRTRDAAMTAVVNRLFRKGLPAVNQARARYGLGPLASFYDQALSADQILVLTNAVFDYASSSVPGNVRYVGPILDDPIWVKPWTPPWPDSDRRPLVLVGFSSTFQDQGPLLRRVVEALSSLAVRAVVTVGQRLDADELTSTSNVAVVASAPHGQVLAEAALVVSHCGHGTTIKTLAAGVPMVCIPMGRDQNDTAARVVHHGAGIRLSPKASVPDIRRAVTKVLGEERFRGKARRLAEAIAHDGLRTDAVDILESIAGS
ncbi:MAG TPA: glycosyltransferase [Acidimicrobiales bacterium]|nr:glycosyltransferase [Acidimicrobiales bacterium]